MSVAKRLMLMLVAALVLLLACSHTAHAHTQVPSAVAPDEAAATAASVASESAPATVAFVDSSVSLDVAAGVAVDPELSSQFLLHHIKAQRTFSTGFRPRHQLSKLLGAQESTCECDLTSRSAGVPAGTDLASRVSVEAESCALPRRFWVSSASVAAKPFSESTRRHLTRLLGYADEASLVRVSGASFSCVDGRMPHGGSLESARTEARSLHAFGGDMGEFVLLLGLLERRAIGGRFYESTVENLMRSWIDTPARSAVHRPSFYFHSDEEALARVAASLGYELSHRNASWVDPAAAGSPAVGPAPKLQVQSGAAEKAEDEQLPYLDFTNPPLHLQTLLLQALIRPDNQGCAHLRLMMTYPELYGVPLHVIQWAIRSYFKILWNKDLKSGQPGGDPLYHKLKFVISRGSHEERAWLNFRVARSCDHVGVAPVWTNRGGVAAWSEAQSKDALAVPVRAGEDAPSAEELEEERAEAAAQAAAEAAAASSSGHGGAQPPPASVFTYHPQAVQHLREEMAEYALGSHGNMEFATALAEINALGEVAEQRTQRMLQKDMPEYNVRLV